MAVPEFDPVLSAKAWEFLRSLSRRRQERLTKLIYQFTIPIASVITERETAPAVIWKTFVLKAAFSHFGRTTLSTN